MRIILPATRFVGRGAELERLGALVRRERLVTILGPPGMGKTRLVAEWLADFGGPFCWTDLSAASNAEDLCAALAHAIDAPHLSGADDAARVGSALAARGELLVVLDGLETVTSHAAALLPGWLGVAPRATLLATSRERLRLAGESCLDLPPLGLPAGDEVGGDAVALLVDRARAAQADWAVDPDDDAVLAQLVRALDGIPLAIELAAARARVLSPRQLLAGLAGGLGLLGRAPLGGPARQATLRAAIDWSWRLLPPEERAALARLSVFRGRFTLDAASAVLGPTARALDTLESLGDKSLVRAVGPASGTDAPSFALYASVRETAADALAAEGEPARREAEARQARWLFTTARVLAAALDGPDGIAARRRLASLRDDLQAVFQRAVRSTGPRRVEALEAALALDPLLVLSGPFSLRRALLAEGLAAAPPDAPPGQVADALDALADAQRTLGAAEAADASLDRAAELAAGLGDAIREARVHTTRGRLRALAGRFDEAEAELGRALELFAEGPPILEARSRAWLATVRVLRGRLTEGARLGQQAVATFRRLGAIVDEAMHASNVGSIEHRMGNLERARELYVRALDVHGEAGNTWSLGWDLTNFALCEHELGRPAAATAAYERALEAMRLAADDRGEGVTLAYRGLLAWDQGRRGDARLDFERAIALHERLGDWTCAALAEACLGALAAGDGSLAVAEECFAAADRALGQGARPQHEAAVRVHLGHLTLCRAGEAERAGRTDDARELRGQARRRAEDGRAIGRAVSAEGPDERSADLRMAVRLLDRALGATPEETDLGGAPEGATADAGDGAAAGALVIARSGRWVRPPTGDRVSLERRRSLRLLVVRLADRRQEAPGEPVAVGELVRSGWPGEDLHPELGAGRLYTALSTLRRLGLRRVLLGRDDGYLLDPSVPLVRVEG